MPEELSGSPACTGAGPGNNRLIGAKARHLESEVDGPCTLAG
jgi:hypothetical protein